MVDFETVLEVLRGIEVALKNFQGITVHYPPLNSFYKHLFSHMLD